MKRKDFLKHTITASSLIAVSPFQVIQNERRVSEKKSINVEQLTDGQKHHWFGYYDKLQVDPTNRYVLGMGTDILGRSPKPDDTLTIGMVDREKDNQWIDLGTSQAFGWQQGCMLQWRPGSTEEIIWNDRKGDQFYARIKNVKTGEERTLPEPIYTLSPDGNFGLSINFARLDNMRLGYGYKGGSDPYVKSKTPEEDGIYRIDLDTGRSKLLVSLKHIGEIPHNGQDISDKWHYFNHLLISPDSKRFIVLNRYRDFYLTPEMKAEENAYAKYVRGNYTTRMLTAGVDSSDIYELDQSGRTSHFIWKNSDQVLAWTRYNGESGYYLFTDQTRKVREIGKGIMTRNGHVTYVPNTNNEWILNDAYPDEKDRKQDLYLYHTPTRKKVMLGRFYQPPVFRDEWRVDLHPRVSQDGKYVFIDSTHCNATRQMYMLDISEIIH